MALQDRIDHLINKALIFDWLKSMGMIGSSGRLAQREASLRNDEIVRLKKELGIDNKTFSILKREASKDWRPE